MLEREKADGELPGALRTVAVGLTGFLALLFGMRFAGAWEAFVRYGGELAYGRVDPIFGNDLAFYLLRLPFVQDVQNALSALALLGLAFVAGGYVFLGNVSVVNGKLTVPRRVGLHLGVDTALVLAAWGWGFYLDRYELLYSRGGLVAGAGYIDVHFVLPALWVMIAASVVMVLVVLAGAYRNRLRLVLLGLGAYAAVAIVGLYLAPPDRALVLSVDEKSQIQVLDRTAPILPMTFGSPERRTHDYRRHGTMSLSGPGSARPRREPDFGPQSPRV